MPRIRRSPEQRPRTRCAELLGELVHELKNARAAGQPLIEEQVFPRTNAVRVTVIWDKWEPVADDDRLDTILQAYEEVEGKAFRERIALALGLTVPEAADAGLLPFQVRTVLRSDDSVTEAQCRQALIAQGASILLDPANPQLRFATEEDAEACRQRLIRELPGSDPVWAITHEKERGD